MFCVWSTVCAAMFGIIFRVCPHFILVGAGHHMNLTSLPKPIRQSGMFIHLSENMYWETIFVRKATKNGLFTQQEVFLQS